jgi:DNA-binding transcriptional LysR family regulator
MRPLATVHFMPFASRNYLEKHGSPTCIADMAHHRIVDQSQYLQDMGAWSIWAADAVVQRTALFTNQSVFLAKSIREGVGIGLLPTYVSIFDRNLVPLDIGVRLPAKLYASYHRERMSMQPVKTTLSFLRTVIFNPKIMPWFVEEFELPRDDWPQKFCEIMSLVRRASDPLQQQETGPTASRPAQKTAEPVSS